MRTAAQLYRESEYVLKFGEQRNAIMAIQHIQREAIAACRATVEKQLIHGALSLQGKTAMEQADAVLAAIDAVKVR